MNDFGSIAREGKLLSDKLEAESTTHQDKTYDTIPKLSEFTSAAVDRAVVALMCRFCAISAKGEQWLSAQGTPAVEACIAIAKLRAHME